MAEPHDHGADHEHHHADRSQRDEDRNDVEGGGQDEARRREQVDEPEGLHGAGAEVLHPGAAVHGGDLVLGDGELADAA
jgi:hypothetical protein